MSHIKRTRILSLLIGAGLLILPVFLVACGTGAEAVAAPVGLRSTAIDDLVQPDPADENEATEPAPAEPAGDLEELAPDTQASTAPAGTGAPGQQARIADRSAHTVDPAVAGSLSTAEIEGLVYMREEEKLARDVYLALYEQWGQPIFQNIAGSEQAHMDSVLMLLEQYGLADPAAGKAQGEFSDPFFQSLYEQLVAQGRISQAEALKVGAGIEELDIVDLQARLAMATNTAVIQVYTNLLAGSQNHLRSFVSNLERQTGELYQPVYLDQDAYQAIVEGAAGRGAGNGGSRGGYGWGASGNGRRNGQNGTA